MGRFTLEKVSTEDQTVYSGDKGVLHQSENSRPIRLDQHNAANVTSVQV
jgi:hypothetical protein